MSRHDADRLDDITAAIEAIVGIHPASYVLHHQGLIPVQQALGSDRPQEYLSPLHGVVEVASRVSRTGSLREHIPLRYVQVGH